MAEHDAKRQEAHEAMRRVASRALPGRAAALPAGSLAPTHQTVQGDENRDPLRRPSPPPGDNPGRVSDHLAQQARRKRGG